MLHFQVVVLLRFQANWGPGIIAETLEEVPPLYHNIGRIRRGVSPSSIRLETPPRLISLRRPSASKMVHTPKGEADPPHVTSPQHLLEHSDQAELPCTIKALAQTIGCPVAMIDLDVI